MLEEESQVALSISDMLGRKVFTEPLKAFEKGTHRLQWTGKNNAGHPVPAGTYMYELRVNGNKQQGPLLLQE